MPKHLSTSEIREMYLAFFESKGHLRFASHAIPVYNDPTLMFSVAGMTQFKAQFVGAPARFAGVDGEWKRVTTAQKCIRIGDIENVGRTNRHCSLFEMMGNFSFDSYFKKEAIAWAWEFLTSPKWLGLEAGRMYATIYKDDDESFGHWTQSVGLPADHIHRFDADENFWPQNAPTKGPNGPCGPCSEIYYDRGEDFGTDTWADYADTRESNRFLEIWNLVFPGYNRSDGPDGLGALEDLGRRNIDTGLGLVRAAMVCQGVEDFYRTDDFVPLVDAVVRLSGKAYEGPKSVSHRVIAEHVRMVAMTLADGVVFGTGEREYVVRKVMRRACRHAYLLGIKEPALHTLVPLVAQTLGDQYPEIRERQDVVAKQMEDEEKRFLATLERGTEMLNERLAKTVLKARPMYDKYLSRMMNYNTITFNADDVYVAFQILNRTSREFSVFSADFATELLRARGNSNYDSSARFGDNEFVITSGDFGATSYEIQNIPTHKVKVDFPLLLSGEDAFTLYDTFGFPLDLTKEIAEEHGIGVDEIGFKAALKRAQELARAGSKYGKKDGVFGTGGDALGDVAATDFVGYNQHETSSTAVVAILKNGERVDALAQGERGEVVLAQTAFYAEGGGQVGDTGLLEWAGGAASVADTQKNAGGVFWHVVAVQRGALNVGQSVTARVEVAARKATERHHSATHLLQAALRATLGAHVQQKGSLVAPERLRFDFTHTEAMGADDVRRVEQIVNRWVQRDFEISAQNMALEDAKKSGAMALFGEKYGETVRVVSVGGAVSTLGILESAAGVSSKDGVSSKELCGGTHVARTGEIGSFVVVAEEGVAAGVRRLEALCGEAATRFVRDNLARLQHLAHGLNTSGDQLEERVQKLQDDLKQKDKDIAALQHKLVQAQTSGGAGAETLHGGGFKVARQLLAGVDGAALRGAADALLDQSQCDVVVVAGDAALVVKASKEAVARGAHAGQLIAKLAAAGGGKGGGRPDMAQAGVQDAHAALAALEAALG